MALELDLFVLLYAFVFGSVEEVKGGHCVWVQPEDDGQREFGKRHDEDDRVGDELDHIDLDAVALGEFIPGELVIHLGLVEVNDPLGVVPEVLRSLHQRVLGLLQDELGLQQQRLLAISEQLLL